MFNLAMSYRQLGKLQAAIDLYRDLLKNHPNDLQTLYQLLLALEHQGGNNEEVKKLKEQIERLRKISPQPILPIPGETEL